MPTDRQKKLFKQAFASKKAFMPLTDQAMAAQGAPMPPQGGAPIPPMDPTMMAQGGAQMPPPGSMPPVDPATGLPIDPATGMPIDPNTGMPMDPAMAAQGGMPPAGAPMDPAMVAQGGAPMPPQGPIQTGDLAIDMLLEMGAMIVDPNGQPVPPEAIAQIVAEINAQTGGQPQGGTAMGNEEVMVTLGQMDKTIALLLDKVDALRDIVDSVVPKKEKSEKEIEQDVNDMDAELAAYLNEQAAQGAQQEPPVEEMPVEAALPMAVPAGIDPAQAQQLSLMQAMQGVQ